MKKNYIKPTIKVAAIQSVYFICTSIGSVGGGTLQYGGAGNGTARGRFHSGWEDDDE